MSWNNAAAAAAKGFLELLKLNGLHQSVAMPQSLLLAERHMCGALGLTAPQRASLQCSLTLAAGGALSQAPAAVGRPPLTPMQGTALRQSMALIARHVSSLSQGYPDAPPPVAVPASVQSVAPVFVDRHADALGGAADRERSRFEPRPAGGAADHAAAPSHARQEWLESAARGRAAALAPPLTEQFSAPGYSEHPVGDPGHSAEASSPRSGDLSAPAHSVSPAPLPRHETSQAFPGTFDVGVAQPLRMGMPVMARHRHQPVEFLEGDAGFELPPPSSPPDEPPAESAVPCSNYGNNQHLRCIFTLVIITGPHVSGTLLFRVYAIFPKNQKPKNPTGFWSSCGSRHAVFPGKYAQYFIMYD